MQLLLYYGARQDKPLLADDSLCLWLTHYSTCANTHTLQSTVHRLYAKHWNWPFCHACNMSSEHIASQQRAELIYYIQICTTRDDCSLMVANLAGIETSTCISIHRYVLHNTDVHLVHCTTQYVTIAFSDKFGWYWDWHMYFNTQISTYYTTQICTIQHVTIAFSD